MRNNPVLAPHRSGHPRHTVISLPLSPGPEGDFAHTQHFTDYLSIFQVGDECDENRYVLTQMQICDRSGTERNNTFCHHAKRGGRKHTGKKCKLEIAEGVVNILQCNVTKWGEHAKHHIITSDFDAALISETHLEREKLVTAAEEARKFSWAGTGSAAISTANNCTCAGVLALVRTRSFSTWVGRFCCFTAYFEHSVGFRSDINANFVQDVCFLTRDGMLPFILGADFNFPAKLVARLVHAWWQPLDTKVGSISGHSRGNHTRAVQATVVPYIIDYFLVSTLIRPLTQKCEIVKSVPWGSHGVKLVLNTNFGSVVSRLIGKISKRSRHNTNALKGQNTHHTEEADPALWNEARRNCISEGKKPRCQDGQEDTQAALWRPGVMPRLMSQIPLSGKFAAFRTKLVLGETFMPLGCVIRRQRRIESLESLRPTGQHDPQSVPQISHSRTRVVCRQENCHFHLRWRHTQ